MQKEAQEKIFKYISLTLGMSSDKDGYSFCFCFHLNLTRFFIFVYILSLTGKLIEIASLLRAKAKIALVRLRLPDR